MSTILVVDDSLTVRMDLVEALQAEGFDALPCASLTDARKAVAQNEIGLLVLDVLLPDGDGVDLLGELRASRSHANVPVLMLSSEAEVKDRIRGLTTGANEYVGKPYDTRYVVSKARELMGEPRQDEPGGRPTVLVIDDSEVFRQTIAQALQGAGYEVITAADGRSGLNVIADRRPGAILVDGVLPDLDGATIIRRVRLDAATRSVPCMLVTASDEGGAQLRALEAGADAFVRKDDDVEVVLARLAAVMRRQAEALVGQVSSLGGPRKILAVDDSPTYLNELADALRNEGYEVSLAPSGEEALELLSVQPVDCILMDLVMPGMGGREACTRIKAAAGLRDIPLILLTAHDDREAMLDGLSAGADDYISKASEFEVVFARVLAQIRRRQFEDENRRYREELLSRELEASKERAARQLAEARAAMVDELERQVRERTLKLEASLVERRHAERMATVGFLSASIAHEINNPLAVVTGNLEQVMDAVRALDKTATPSLAATEASLSEALEAAERVRVIVHDLKVFARSDEAGVAEPVHLHKVIDTSIRMARNEIRHRAHLVRAFGEEAHVIGSESQLGQVFLNLIVNAAQAIPVGRAEHNTITVSIAQSGADHVAIEVADTGVGIPEDELENIFEPFFTTKPVGVGSGLGLAICHRIIGELGGAISARSKVGEGTVFQVLLPRARAPEGNQPVPASDTRPIRRGRVLILDDEPALCRTFARMLEKQHDVVGLTSARDAIGMIRSGERFDAIVSDLMMPEMTGIEFHRAVCGAAPDQAERLIFMSGGALTPEAVKFFNGRSYKALEKPFTPAALRNLVQQVVESETGDARCLSP